MNYTLRLFRDAIGFLLFVGGAATLTYLAGAYMT